MKTTEKAIALKTFPEKQKLIYLEVLRIIAIFFVIFNHTGNQGFCLFTQKPVGSIQFWVYMFLSIFCKFAVPLYFTVSGALFLNRDPESLTKLWKKRICRMILVLLVISLFRYMLIHNTYIFNLHDYKTFFTQIYFLHKYIMEI